MSPPNRSNQEWKPNNVPPFSGTTNLRPYSDWVPRESEQRRSTSTFGHPNRRSLPQGPNFISNQNDLAENPPKLPPKKSNSSEICGDRKRKFSDMERQKDYCKRPSSLSVPIHSNITFNDSVYLKGSVNVNGSVVV